MYQIGHAAGFSALGFLVYAVVYSVFSGHSPDRTLVHYYSFNGTLIMIMDSSDINSNYNRNPANVKLSSCGILINIAHIILFRKEAFPEVSMRTFFTSSYQHK